LRGFGATLGLKACHGLALRILAANAAARLSMHTRMLTRSLLWRCPIAALTHDPPWSGLFRIGEIGLNSSNSGQKTGGVGAYRGQTRENFFPSLEFFAARLRK
jgi:hypothetical protein